jgi:hypothetical protein
MEAESPSYGLVFNCHATRWHSQNTVKQLILPGERGGGGGLGSNNRHL